MRTKPYDCDSEGTRRFAKAADSFCHLQAAHALQGKIILNGGQGFIQNFSVRVGGKKNVHRATPSGGVWHDAPPGNLHALRLLLGLQNGWKLATNELLNIKKNINFKILGGGGSQCAPTSV